MNKCDEASPQGRPNSNEDAMDDTKEDAGKDAPKDSAEAEKPEAPEEIGGPAGPEPTRFGDWEKAGRCSDF
jgi:hypothetical protein